MNKCSLPVFFILSALSFCAPASNHGHGRVQLKGNIIDTACAISAGDAEQGIELGTLAFDELVRKGRGPAVPFTIHLVNCVLNPHGKQDAPSWKDVRITFDGEPAGASSFALQGDARGGALVIVDPQGYRARPGERMPPVSLTPGSMSLRYQLWLTGDSRAIRPGHYHTTVRYFMEYD